MNLRRFLFFMSMVLWLVSCQDLDPLLFNPDTEMTEYLWDKNPVNYYFDSEEYPIRSGEFHHFTIESDHEGQTETLHALYLGDLQTIDKDTVVVYCHGNTGSMDHYYPRAQLLYHVGEQSRYGVLMMDYRGFGLSTGVPLESSLMSDVNTCLEWLKDRGLSAERTIMYGYSLGSIPAVHLSANPKALSPQKLILEAPIGCISTMSSNGSTLSFPSSFFADLETDNIEEIKNVDQDLCWIHGLNDNFLNYYTHGEPIYTNHKGDYKVSFPVPLGDHHDTPFQMGEVQYLEAINEFIKR